MKSAMLIVDNYWLDYNGFTGYPQTYPQDVKKISTDYIKQKMWNAPESYPQKCKVIHKLSTEVIHKQIKAVTVMRIVFHSFHRPYYYYQLYT